MAKSKTKQDQFRKQAMRVADKILGDEDDVTFYDRNETDGAFEDDGCLHVTKHGLRAAFSIGQDTDGYEANEKTRDILIALKMKRYIGKSTLVEENCSECDGDGSVMCDLSCDHPCPDCNGTGFTTPDDYI